jgi:hypothetical protein
MNLVDSVSPQERVNPKQRLQRGFKRYLYRWQRCRSKDWIAYYEAQSRHYAERAKDEKDNYLFWIRKEQAEGVQWYDDRDRTWKLEFFFWCLIFGIVAGWLLVYLLLKPHGYIS